jgi:hypothetical protein
MAECFYNLPVIRYNHIKEIKKMKYSLLAIALATLTLTACDQMKEHKPGEGKPGQYPPSLWEKREGQVSDSDIEAAQKAEAEAAKKNESSQEQPK